MHDPAQPAPWTGAGHDAPDYDDLRLSLEGLLAGEDDPLACLANTAAAIFHALPDLNWAGFYLLRNAVLVLGPFQGRPACVRIPLGQGVCGSAAEAGRSVLVPDVAAFPGHIACDLASRSELVVPMRGKKGGVIGVLDLDSPRTGRFTVADQAGCERLAALAAPYAEQLVAPC
jgi:GAF domain-containing protein